jgi:hypothetical protein
MNTLSIQRREKDGQKANRVAPAAPASGKMRAAELPIQTRIARFIIWLVLIIVATQALLFGSLLPIQQAGVFPVIVIGDYHIRLEEIVIIFGICLYLMLLIANALSQRAIYIGRNYQSFLFVWVLIGLAQASLRGFLANQPENMLETRMLIIPLLYFFLASSCMRYEWLPTFSKRISILLLFPVILLCWDSIMPIGDLFDRAYGSIGWVYGGWGMGMMALIIFFLCLIVSGALFRARIRSATNLLIMFIIVGLVIRISKPGWANMLAVFFFMTILVLTMKKGAISAETYRKRVGRWVVLILGSCSLLLFMFFFYRGEYPERAEGYLSDVEARVVRYDAGRDFTGGRLDLFIEGLNRFKQAPVFGRGNGFWYEYWQEGNFSQRVPDHFTILSFLIRGGIFTTLPILLLALWYIRRGLWICQEIPDSSVRPFVVACYLYNLVIFFYSLFANPQNVLEVSLLFWLSISVVICAGKRIDENMRLDNRRIAAFIR